MTTVYYEDMTPLSELEPGEKFVGPDSTVSEVIGPCVYYGLDAVKVRIGDRETEWLPTQRVVRLEDWDRPRAGRPPVMTDGDVRELRRLYDAGEATQADLAARYGVTQSHVSNLISGRRRATA